MRPLAKTPPPLEDELLGSWLRRLAEANYCSHKELHDYLAVKTTVNELGLEDYDLAKVATAGRQSIDQLRQMSLKVDDELLTRFTSARPFQICLTCIWTSRSETLDLKHWREAWRIRCHICGTRLSPIIAPYETCDESWSKLRRWDLIENGAALLESAIKTRDLRFFRRVHRLSWVLSTFSTARSVESGLLSSTHADRMLILTLIGKLKRFPLLKIAILLGPLNDPKWAGLSKNLKYQKHLLKQLRTLRASFDRRTG